MHCTYFRPPSSAVVPVQNLPQVQFPPPSMSVPPPSMPIPPPSMPIPPPTCAMSVPPPTLSVPPPPITATMTSEIEEEEESSTSKDNPPEISVVLPPLVRTISNSQQVYSPNMVLNLKNRSNNARPPFRIRHSTRMPQEANLPG